MFSSLFVVLGCATLLGLHSSIDASPVSRTLRDAIQPFRDDYTYTSGLGAYKVHSRMANWNTARRTCKEEGAHLGVMNSVAEVNAVIQLFGASNAHQVYVGLHDFYQEGEFVSIHDESAVETGFNEWQAGEPNNYGNREHCVVLTAAGVFNDGECATLENFVCELPEVYVPRASR